MRSVLRDGTNDISSMDWNMPMMIFSSVRTVGGDVTGARDSMSPGRGGSMDVRQRGSTRRESTIIITYVLWTFLRTVRRLSCIPRGSTTFPLRSPL